MNKGELLRKFFDETLSTEEQVIFDELLKNDPEFIAAFEYEKHQNKLVTDDIENNLDQQSDFSSSFLRYAVAACIIIGLSVFISKSFINTINMDDLFAQNFEPYQYIIRPIESREGIDKTQEEAFFKYETKDYEAAIKGFETEFEKTNDSYYLFYIANAYLALDTPKKAIPLLEKNQTFNDDFREKSQWYLALAYLKDDNEDKSIALLEEISNGTGYHNKKAKDLLKAIR